MKIHELSPAEGSRKNRKRVGRGTGSGHGGTACRGNKGQKSRSGGNIRPGFEGGQMPLQRRIPKRGFFNIFKKQYNIINVQDLNCFDKNSVCDQSALEQAGLIHKLSFGVKLLGNGEISQPLVVKVNKASKSAIEKIQAAGGAVEFV